MTIETLYIRKQSELPRLCEQLASADRVAVDTDLAAHVAHRRHGPEPEIAVAGVIDNHPVGCPELAEAMLVREQLCQLAVPEFAFEQKAVVVQRQ